MNFLGRVWLAIADSRWLYQSIVVPIEVLANGENAVEGPAFLVEWANKPQVSRLASCGCLLEMTIVFCEYRNFENALGNLRLWRRKAGQLARAFKDAPQHLGCQ